MHGPRDWFSWRFRAVLPRIPGTRLFKKNPAARHEDLVKSLFPLPWWEGGVGAVRQPPLPHHPHPNPPPSRGREFWTFYETIRPGAAHGRHPSACPARPLVAIHNLYGVNQTLS